MQKYKDLNGQVHELDSEYFEYLLPPGSVKITDAEAAELLAPSPATLWAARQAEALAALAANDLVAIRCAKANVKYPAEWQAYDGILRSIVSASSGDATAAFPERPDYPSGT
ncbi:phage tail protein [Herbaspirillum sp. DW155]|uniref:hypothetical protein n=1 Tax=Herbaspirillum sp. DW155 TaxID=3095609 RepID=UPI00308C7E8B|nr:phage tail protein [Herbaspirillum sp. DW155]